MITNRLSILIPCLLVLQSACSSAGGGDGPDAVIGAETDSAINTGIDTDNNDSVNSGEGGSVNVSTNAGAPMVLPGVSEVTAAPEGNVTHYGALSIADDLGTASDLVGSFYRLERGVSSEFLSALFTGQSTQCDVQDDGTIGFEGISAGFLPIIPGVRGTAVSAGPSLLLSSQAGTYATLQEQPAAGFLFYDLANMSMLMDGQVPETLTVDVPGSGEIPAFFSTPVPAITTFGEASPGVNRPIAVDTLFTWEPSDDPAAMVRIHTSTAGGFFLEDGVTVTCVTPDTGSFRFPPQTVAVLGTDFEGSPALMSRIVVNTVQVDTTVLYVIRESFR